MRFPQSLASALVVASFLLLLLACNGSPGPASTPPPLATATPGATASPRATATPTVAPTAGTALAPSDFDPQRALAHVQALAADIGSRPAGTEAELAAADYIADQLHSFGYEVQEQSFTFEAFIDLGTTLEVVSPQQRRLEPLPMRPTVSGLVEAEIVDAGLGRPEDFPADATGKIALMQRGQLFFSDKAANAAAAGAAAAIVYNNRPGQFTGALGQETAIPVVSIPQEEGQLILDLLATGPVTLRLEVRVETGTRNSENVIGRPPQGDCQVYVGGHYDSVSAGPGANDNASGTATVLEIARVLAADGELDAVCFIAFGAEEVGLVGSIEFVAALPPEERGSIIAMLNLDMVGVGNRWLFEGDGAIARIAAQEADRLRLTYVTGNLPPGTSSDHASFRQAGIPAMIVHRLGDPRFHTGRDRAEFIDPQLLGDAGRLSLALIDALLHGR